MRISNSFIYNNPTFGYDKKLNTELKDKLAAHPDREWARDLSTMNNYVNRLETRVSREAKKKDALNNSKHQDYLDMFLTLKNMVAGFVSITFSDLDYASREFNHYYDEYVKSGANPNDWHLDACESLQDWVEPDLAKKLPQKPKESDKKQIYVPQFDEDGVEISPEKAKSELSPRVQNIINRITGGQLSQKSFLEEYKPSDESPKSFSDVAGMSTLKRDLEEGIIQLIKNPEQAQMDLEDYGKKIPKGILLYGPPGCGKTYITQALSQEVGVPLYMLSISKTGSEYINMTAKNIKASFDEAIAIAEKSDRPCLLFMDEIDTMAFDRNSRMEPDDLKQVGTILQSMDEAKAHNIIIIGATNKYNILDPAVKRRFDAKYFVDIPDNDSILSLLKKNLAPLRKGKELLESEEDLNAVAKLLYGYSNSSICQISKDAATNAMRRDRANISVQDYEKAIKDTGEEKPNRKEYMADSKKSSSKIGF